jgi:hypothetical protein
MKRTTHPRELGTTEAPATSDPLSVLSRIRPEFLDEYTCEKQGYDPYDTSKRLAPDVWTSKRKRG